MPILSRWALLISLSAGMFVGALSFGQPAPSSPATGSRPTAQTVASATPAAVATQTQNPLVLGLELYRHHKYTEAEQAFQAALQQDAKAGPAYAWLARTYLAQHKVTEAFDIATKGVAQAGDGSWPHTALGEVLFRKGQILPDAEAQFLHALKINAFDARAYYGLYRIYRCTSNYRRAKIALTKAHELDPSDPQIRRAWLGTLKYSEQLVELRRLLDGGEFENEQSRDTAQKRLQWLHERIENPQHACRLVSDGLATEAPLEPMMVSGNRLHGWGLKVTVNGKAAQLLLDTGASGLVVSRRVAERAGLQYSGETQIGGIGDKGAQAGHFSSADSIKIGKLEFKDCPVRVSEKADILDDDGLIGTDVFSRFLVDIDFLGRTLKLSPLPKRPDEQTGAVATLQTESDPDEAQGIEGKATDTNKPEARKSDTGPYDRYVAPEMKSYTPVFRFGHDLLVATKVEDSPEKLFLVDTGATSSSIATDFARTVGKVRTDPYTHVRGLSGQVKEVYNLDQARLEFAHLRQQAYDLHSYDLSRISRSSGVEVSGILGYSVLGILELKIDYRDGLVEFLYDEAKLRGHMPPGIPLRKK